jgi:hypothetical protein
MLQCATRCSTWIERGEQQVKREGPGRNPRPRCFAASFSEARYALRRRCQPKPTNIGQLAALVEKGMAGPGRGGRKADDLSGVIDAGGPALVAAEGAAVGHAVLLGVQEGVLQPGVVFREAGDGAGGVDLQIERLDVTVHHAGGD